MRHIKITTIFFSLLLVIGCGKILNGVTANTSTLTNEKAQRAVDKALEWTKIDSKA